MLRAPRKLVLAVEVLLDIAYNAGDAPVQSADLTARLGIPRRYLEPVLQQMVRDGVLASNRGPRGGYRLARERGRITVGEIVRVVRAAEGSEGGPEEAGSPLGDRVVRPLFAEAEAELMARLDAVTLQDLCARARSEGLESALERRLDFVI
jgi:Rrf2 family iron-sulfur cluster assembly transcriptional regulator